MRWLLNTAIPLGLKVRDRSLGCFYWYIITLTLGLDDHALTSRSNAQKTCRVRHTVHHPGDTSAVPYLQGVFAAIVSLKLPDPRTTWFSPHKYPTLLRRPPYSGIPTQDPSNPLFLATYLHLGQTCKFNTVSNGRHDSYSNLGPSP